MQLDQLAARIRPRTAWEGIDLGFVLARHWLLPLWGLWWLGALPVGIAAALWLPSRPDLWIFVVWWLKPLYEAALLFWLSRAIFGSLPRVGDLWRERRKVLPLRLLPGILWRRLQPSRSFRLPLLQLEALKGSELRQRWRLIQGTDGAGAWLTLICVHFESILWISALVLLLFLVPDGLPRLDLGAALLEVDSRAYWVSAVLYWIAMSVMAPFYVAAGFALYLTRRTQLEAWDLELLFRQAAVESRERRRRASCAGIALALAVPLLGTPPPLEAAVPLPDPEEARSLVAEVLAGKDFGGKRETTTWVYVGRRAEDPGGPDLPDWLTDALELIAASSGPIATSAKWLLILLAALGSALVLRRVLLDLHRRERRHGPEQQPTLSAQEASRPPGGAPIDELKTDVEVRLRELIAAGSLRAALALLYRASLAQLMQGYALEIPPSATELECLTLVADAGPTQDTVLLCRLTRTWQRLAYGHRSPDAEEVAELLRDWRHLRGGPGEV
jgi:hypothetical protein